MAVSLLDLMQAAIDLPNYYRQAMLTESQIDLLRKIASKGGTVTSPDLVRNKDPHKIALISHRLKCLYDAKYLTREYVSIPGRGRLYRYKLAEGLVL